MHPSQAILSAAESCIYLVYTLIFDGSVGMISLRSEKRRIMKVSYTVQIITDKLRCITWAYIDDLGEAVAKYDAILQERKGLLVQASLYKIIDDKFQETVKEIRFDID